MWRCFPEKKPTIELSKKSKKKKKISQFLSNIFHNLCVTKHEIDERFHWLLVICERMCVITYLYFFSNLSLQNDLNLLYLDAVRIYGSCYTVTQRWWDYFQFKIGQIRSFFEAKEIKLKYFKMLENVKSLLNPLCCAKKRGPELERLNFKFCC